MNDNMEKMNFDDTLRILEEQKGPYLRKLGQDELRTLKIKRSG